MERERTAFDGRRQREALAEFQRRAGLDATAAAQAVHLSYPQYNRYLWGRVPLRTDQIRLFARAYGITQADLTRALGLLDDELVAPAPPATSDAERQAAFEADVERRIGPRGDTIAEAVINEARGRSGDDQQAVLSVVETLLRNLPPHTGR